MKKQFLSILAAGLMLGGTSQVKAMDLKGVAVGVMLGCASNFNAIDFAECLKTAIPLAYVWCRLAPHGTNAYRDAILHTRLSCVDSNGQYRDDHDALTLITETGYPRYDYPTPLIRVILRSYRPTVRMDERIITSMPVITPHEGESIESYLDRCKKQVESIHAHYKCLLSEPIINETPLSDGKCDRLCVEFKHDDGQPLLVATLSEIEILPERRNPHVIQTQELHREPVQPITINEDPNSYAARIVERQRELFDFLNAPLPDVKVAE